MEDSSNIFENVQVGTFLMVHAKNRVDYLNHIVSLS